MKKYLFLAAVVVCFFGIASTQATAQQTTLNYFTFTFGSDFVTLNGISTFAEANLAADLLQSDTPISESGTGIVVGPNPASLVQNSNFFFEISGLSAPQRTEVVDLVNNLSSVVVTTYLNTNGALRYRITGTVDLASGTNPDVMVTSSRVLALANQSFTLGWNHARLTSPSCRLTGTGPAVPTLPTGATLNVSGSVSLAIATPGDYTFTYTCMSSGTPVVDTVTVTVVPSHLPVATQLNSPTCIIAQNMSSCEAAISWDSYALNGTFRSLTLTNLTTQTLVSTDVRGLNRPVTLRHATNTFALVGVVVGIDGTEINVNDTVTGVAVCQEYTVWNGSMCVSGAGGGGWDIISDIEFYGPGYAGMPARNGGSFTNPSNTSCRAMQGWVCSTQQNADPVSLEFYADGQLIHTTPTNISRRDTVFASYGRSYGNMPGCMSGVSSHALTGFRFDTPAFLKDGVTRNIQIKATRADGVSRWVTWNSWNGNAGYPDGPYQNFPLNCPAEPASLDLAGYLTFPATVAQNQPVTISGARVMNAGTVNLATSTQVAIQFDYNGDNNNGVGGPNDFVIWTNVNNINSGQTVFANFAPVVLPVAGNWKARVWVDPNSRVEAATTTRGNNISRWVDVSVGTATTTPTATLDPRGCTVSAGASSCSTRVTWTSENLVGGTELLQGASRISTTANNLSTGLMRTVTMTDKTFTVRSGNGAFRLSRSADVRCDGPWDNNQNPPVCLATNPSDVPPQITVQPVQRIVRFDSSTDVVVEITAGYPMTCTVTGISGGPSTINHLAAGTQTYRFTTSAIQSTRTITVTCNPPSLAPVSSSAVIEVVPIPQEV